MSQADGYSSAPESVHTRSSRLLPLIRVLALGFMLACGLVFIAGVLLYTGYSSAYPEKFTVWNWTVAEMEQILSRVGLSFDGWVQYHLIGAILFAVIQCSVGLFIFYRKRDDWFVIYVAAAFVLFGTQTGYPLGAVRYMYPALESVLMPLGVLAWLSLFMIFYVFPDGRFVPGWTRWAALVLIISYFIDIWIYGGQTPPPPLLMVMMLMILVAVGGQVYRYQKVSTPLQRQQTKVVLLALTVVFGIVLLMMTPLFSPGLLNAASPLAWFLVLMSGGAPFIMGLIPISIALAILRYRLWDLDVIIRRTLVYGGLTASLGLIYLGGVVLMQGIFTALTGESRSEIVIVTTTLAIAALFTPLRKRIQQDIDRRFFREKYSAEQILLSFANMARQETDIDALTGKLIGVVRETVQPEYLNLWIMKEEEKGTREA